MKSTVLFLFLVGFVLNSPAAEKLSSPDGKLSITVSTESGNSGPNGAGRLVYSVEFEGKALLKPSHLRLDFEGEQPLGPNVRIAGASRSSRNEKVRLITGKSSTARDRCNELRVELQETAAPGRQFAIDARAYDDAIAFRYMMPEQAGLRNFNLSAERTEFHIAKDATSWCLFLPHFRSMYESEFIKLPLARWRTRAVWPARRCLGCRC